MSRECVLLEVGAWANDGEKEAHRQVAVAYEGIDSRQNPLFTAECASGFSKMHDVFVCGQDPDAEELCDSITEELGEDWVAHGPVVFIRSLTNEEFQQHDGHTLAIPV